MQNLLSEKLEKKEILFKNQAIFIMIHTIFFSIKIIRRMKTVYILI